MDAIDEIGNAMEVGTTSRLDLPMDASSVGGTSSTEEVASVSENDDEYSNRPLEFVKSLKTCTEEADVTVCEEESKTIDAEDSKSIESQSTGLKVPRLKIICSKGDFSLVVDSNEDKSQEGSELTPTVSEADEKPSTDETMMSNDFEKENDLSAQRTVSDEPAGNPSLAKVKTQREEEPERAKRIRTSVIEEVDSHGGITTDQLNATSENNLETNNIIRRKLRSHTRQKVGKGSNDSGKSFDNNDSDESKKDETSNSSSSNSGSSNDHQQSAEDDRPSQSTSRRRKPDQNADKSEEIVESSNTIDPCQLKDDQINEPHDGCVKSDTVASNLISNCLRKYVELRSQISKNHMNLMNTNSETKLPKNYNDFVLFKKNYLVRNNKEARLSIPFVSLKLSGFSFFLFVFY
jgi:hypothetical protein